MGATFEEKPVSDQWIEIPAFLRKRDVQPDLFEPLDPKAVLIADLARQGYFEIRQCLRTGKLYGLYRFIYTIGLCCDLQEHHYAGRYCYPSLNEALPGLRDWQARGFEGAPVGFIKYKGHQ